MAGQLTIDTLKASSGVLATQNGMTGIAKAWVVFNGANGAIYGSGSFNVSSVTRSSTGVYTINFTTAMGSTTYAAAGKTSATASGLTTFTVTTYNTGSFVIQALTLSGTTVIATDPSIVNVIINAN